MARRESTRMQAALREYAGRRRYREQGKRSWVTCFPKMETSSSPNGASSVSGSPGDGAESRRVSRRGDQRGRRNRSQLIRQLRAILHHGTLDVYTCSCYSKPCLHQPGVLLVLWRVHTVNIFHAECSDIHVRETQAQ
jgi:hypothetical protein